MVKRAREWASLNYLSTAVMKLQVRFFQMCLFLQHTRPQVISHLLNLCKDLAQMKRKDFNTIFFDNVDMCPQGVWTHQMIDAMK